MALVSGAERGPAGLAAALAGVGFDPRWAPDRAAVADVCRALVGDPVHCYVQLPCVVTAPTAPLAQMRALVATSLVARFDALAAVAPFLAPGAVVVVVGGDRAGRFFDHDLGVGEILATSAGAILAEAGAGTSRIAIVGPDRAAADIADLAAGGAGPVVVDTGSWVAYGPELSYSEWRSDVLWLSAQAHPRQRRLAFPNPEPWPAGALRRGTGRTLHPGPAAEPGPR